MATPLTSLYAENQTSVETESFSVTGGRLVEIYIFLFSDPAVGVYFEITGFGATWTLRAGDPSVIFDKPMMYSGVPASGGSGTLTITARDSADGEPTNCSTLAIEVIEHGANVLATDNGDLTYEQAAAARGASSIGLSAFDALANLAYGWFIVFAGAPPTATAGSGLTLDGDHTAIGWGVAARVSGANVPTVGVTWSDDGFFRHGIALELVTVGDVDPPPPEPEADPAIAEHSLAALPISAVAATATAIFSAAVVAVAAVAAPALALHSDAPSPVAAIAAPAVALYSTAVPPSSSEPLSSVALHSAAASPISALAQPGISLLGAVSPTVSALATPSVAGLSELLSPIGATAAPAVALYSLTVSPTAEPSLVAVALHSVTSAPVAPLASPAVALSSLASAPAPWTSALPAVALYSLAGAPISPLAAPAVALYSVARSPNPTLTRLGRLTIVFHQRRWLTIEMLDG